MKMRVKRVIYTANKMWHVGLLYYIYNRYKSNPGGEIGTLCPIFFVPYLKGFELALSSGKILVKLIFFV